MSRAFSKKIPFTPRPTIALDQWYAETGGTKTTLEIPVTIPNVPGRKLIVLHGSGASATVTSVTLAQNPMTQPVTPMQPVQIVGDRLYSGGRPWFSTTNFLENFATANFSHIYWSDNITATEKTTIFNTVKNNGYNTMYLYLLNEGDYGARVVTPFLSGFSGAYDTAKIALWRSDMLAMLAQGIRPVLWLRADDSPTINAISNSAFKAYMQRMVDEFDDLPIMWVLGLEVNDYWTLAEANDYGTFLRGIAQQPVGVHTRSGSEAPASIDFMSQAWVEVSFAQQHRNNPWQDHYEWMKAAKNAMGGRPVIWAEYRQNAPLPGTPDETLRFSIAGTFAGAAGYGNGGPPDLGAFMEALPNGMSSSRSGSIITMTGEGTTAQANPDNLTFQMLTSNEIPLAPITSAFASAGSLRQTGFYLDTPPIGASTLRINTSVAARSVARIVVLQNTHAGEPGGFSTVFDDGTRSFDVAIGGTDDSDINLADAFSISLDLLFANGVTTLGQFTPSAGQMQGNQSVINNVFFATTSTRRHANNGRADHGWATETVTPTALLHTVVNVLHGAGGAEPPPSGTPYVAVSRWKLDEVSQPFVDEFGVSDATIRAGTFSGGTPALLADGGTSISVNGTQIHADGGAGEWLFRSHSHKVRFQARAHPAPGKAVGLLVRDKTLPSPGGISIEQYNDNGTSRLRAYIRDAVGTVGHAIFVTPQTGVGTLVPGTAYVAELTYDDETKTAVVYLNLVEVARKTDLAFHGLQDNANGYSLFSRFGTAGSEFNGLGDICEVGSGVRTAAQIAGDAAPVSVTDPGVPSGITAVADALGSLTAGGTQDFDILANDTGLGAGNKDIVITQQPSQGSITVLNNNTATPTIRVTKTTPATTAVLSARYHVRESGGQFSNEATISYSIPGQQTGSFTPFPFVTTLFGPVSNAGVQGRPPFNAADPSAPSARRTDPQSGIEFFRVSGSVGTPVLLKGSQSTGLVWPKVTKSENAPSCFRGFNADGSILLLCESKSIGGDPSNSCRFSIVDCTGEHGATKPFQIIRAHGQAYAGEVSGPGCFWDPLDRYSMYAVLDGTPQAMWRWWPFGRPAGGGEPARAVGAKVKLYNLPSGFGEMHFPRGGRARPSIDGQWYFLPAKRLSDKKWGGIRLNLHTGATGPFILNPDQPNDDNDRAIGKTSSQGTLGYFSYQNLSHNSIVHGSGHPAGGHDTRNARFVNMQTGAIVSGANSIIGGHGDYLTIDGKEYIIGIQGGKTSGWWLVDPATATFVRKLADTEQMETEHNNNNNYFDTFDIYGAAGGSTSGHRYTICSVTVPYSTAGIYGVRCGATDFNKVRYLINPRSQWTVPPLNQKNNFAEVHPHFSPRPNNLGQWLLYFNSNWMRAGESDINHVNSYIALIPDAWESPNNDGSAV